MTSPYGDEPKCAELSDAELKDTFWHPGPYNLYIAPGKRTQEHWDRAKEVCIECPIFLKCRDRSWGEEYGVFGGTDQYERFKERQRRLRRLQRLNAASKAAVAVQLEQLYKTERYNSPAVLARYTGLPAKTVKRMLKEHWEATAADKARTTPKRVPEYIPTDIVWPVDDPPTRDAWVWRSGVFHEAFYVGQTDAGDLILVNFNLGHMRPVKTWMPEEQVSIRKPITPVIKTYWGKSNGRAETRQAESSKPQ